PPPVGEVVLPARAPSLHREIRPPSLPVVGAPPVRLEPPGFGIAHGRIHPPIAAVRGPNRALGVSGNERRRRTAARSPRSSTRIRPPDRPRRPRRGRSRRPGGARGRS